MTSLVLLLLMVLALLGLPLFVTIAAAALWLFHADGLDLQILAIEMNRLASMPVLVAMPLFTFAGTLLAEGQTPRRIIDVARAMVGRRRGGVSLVALVTCGVFTAATGASGVTIVALGGLLFALLRGAGYSDRFTVGLLTTGGSYGLLFPPSLPVILYAVVAQIPIQELYNAAFLPGLLMVTLLAITALFMSRKPESVVELEPPPSLGVALRESIFEWPLPLIVMVGIYLGWLTVVEAATLTVTWVLVVQVLIRREVGILSGHLLRVARESLAVVGATLLILAVSQGLTNYLIDAQIPDRLFAWLQPVLQDRFTFLLALNGFLLVVGCMMDIFSATVVVVPLLLPLAARYQVDPLHLGVIFLANLEMGYVTPPVGLNLFLASMRFRRSMWELYRATLPFLLVMVVATLLITWLPELALWWK